MRSSASTPSLPRDPPLRLYVLLAGEDHPRACTGRRLIHRGLAVPPRRSHNGGPSPIVLDPYARIPLSVRDRDAAASGGLLAVDCSWNRLTERGHFPGEALPAGPRRRLPILIATNPQHYGRVAQLNTVEALAAAVHLLGRPDQSAELLGGFRGAAEFLAVNADRLREYEQASDAPGVALAERRLFGGPESPATVTPPRETSAPRSRDARPRSR